MVVEQRVYKIHNADMYTGVHIRMLANIKVVENKMKKLLILLLTICSFISGFGQKVDSTIFNKYNLLEYVDSVFYQKQYYSNNTLKHEGWVLVVSLKEGQKLGNVIGKKGIEIPIEQNIGTHYYYNKRGVKIKDVIISDDLISENKENIYDKKGHLIKRVFYQENENIVFNITNNKDKVIRNSPTIKSIRTEHYFKGKLSYTTGLNTNMEKDGCWKVYDNQGVIKSEKYYQNGELVSKKCP